MEMLPLFLIFALALMPLEALRLAGRAAGAQAMRVSIPRMVIGRGPVLCTLRVGARNVQVRALPLGGQTRLSVLDPVRARHRKFNVIAVGTAFEIGMGVMLVSLLPSTLRIAGLWALVVHLAATAVPLRVGVPMRQTPSRAATMSSSSSD